MTTDEELQTAASALSESVRVVGVGDTGRRAAGRVTEREVPASDEAADPDAVIYAVDGTSSAEFTFPEPREEVPIRVAVVSLPRHPSPDERTLLETLRSLADAVVLSPGGEDELVDAVATFVSVVREPGFVNLDLADARTILADVDRAALGIGESDRGQPADAVEDAFGALPAGVETDPATGVLVDLLGGPEMSVEDVSDAVTAVRRRVGPDAHVIWGGAVEPSLGEGVRVRLVVAGVQNGRVTAEDPCPRCETSLSAYTLGSRTTVTCDNCGFAGVSVRLRD